jgi:hypothetical protein
LINWRVGKKKDPAVILEYLTHRYPELKGVKIPADALAAIAIGTAWIDRQAPQSREGK